MIRRCAFLLAIIVIVICACEERFEIEAEFPSEQNVVFCELVGAEGIGFFGQVSLLRNINETEQNQGVVNLRIWEDNTTVIDTSISFGSILVPHLVNENSQYKLEVIYQNQTIESGVEHLPEELLVSNYMVDNSFVDSLGFDVTTISLQIDNNASEEIYYLVNYILQEEAIQTLSLNSAEEADSIAVGKTGFLQKRLPNMEQYSYSQTSVASIDRGLFQYVKSIQGFGSIPNDDLEGHQGNLGDAVGYFGLIRLDYFLDEIEQ